MVKHKDDEFDYGIDPEIAAAISVPPPEVRDDYVDTSVPIVFINVDGVLNPGDPDITHYGKNCYPYRKTIEIKGVQRSIALNPEHGPLLMSLVKRGAELVWMTTWDNDANKYIGKPLGLPPLRHVPFPEEMWGEDDGGLKAVTALDWSRGRPFVWFDDSLTLGNRLHFYWESWRIRRHSPNPMSPYGMGTYLYIRIDSAIGLRPAHIKKADFWLQQTLRVKPAK